MSSLGVLVAVFGMAGACLSAAAAQTRKVATEGPRILSRYSSENWTTAQGLPGDTVRAVTQTRDGYLWVGTQAGLARFDGVRFTLFTQGNVKELRSNECSTLLEGADGSLWIGTIGGGLARYRDGKFTNYGRADGLASDVVNHLYEDRAGRLWITTYQQLTLFENGKFQIFAQGDGVTNVYAVPFYEDERGRLWIFNSRGLGYSNAGTLSFYENGRLNADASAARLFPFGDGEAFCPFRGRDGGDTLWLNFYESGELMRVREGRAEKFPLEMSGRSIAIAHEDAGGDLWMGTGDSTLQRWRAGRLISSVAEGTLPHGLVNAIFADREGNVWTGTNDGLTRLKDQAFATYSTKDGLSNERAWTIFEDSRGDIWTGTDAGLNRLRETGFTIYTHRDGLAGSAVVSIAEDREGRLWFGSTDGLSSFKDGKFKAFRAADGLLSENVRSVHVDHAGRLWVGTVGGLHLYENAEFKAYTTKDGLSNNNVLFIYESRDAGLWVGTPNGLNRMRDGRFEVFGKGAGLASEIAIAAHEDEEGTLWFGTVGGGLARFREGKFTSINSGAGLGDDTITQILEDGEGNFWLGSLGGVLRVSRRELNDFADGRAKSVTSVAYGKVDGMLSTDCSGGTQPAGWRTRDGRLWFPTARGISFVDPQGLRRNVLPPPIRIESLMVDNVSFPVADEASLPAGSRAIEFDFTALSFVDPSKVKFKYKLEGFDTDWVDAGTRRAAFYTNLPPGSYRLRVIASNNDGVWNTEGSSVAFTLRPYFYQSLWFYLICLLAACAAAWGVHRLRVRQLKREFGVVLQERSRIARELHDSLAQGFTSVSMQLEALGTKLDTSPAAAREHLNQARLMVRSSLAEARRTVRDLRSELLDGGDLASALAKVAGQLTAGTETSAGVEVSGARRGLPEAVENNLLRVGQEALTNAVRHGEARSVRVRLRYDDRHVHLSIEDDGRGFDPETLEPGANGGGFGLRGMRERLARLGGELSIDSRPGAGTEVSVVVPVDAAKN